MKMAEGEMYARRQSHTYDTTKFDNPGATRRDQRKHSRNTGHSTRVAW